MSVATNSDTVSNNSNCSSSGSNTIVESCEDGGDVVEGGVDREDAIRSLNSVMNFIRGGYDASGDPTTSDCCGMGAGTVGGLSSTKTLKSQLMTPNGIEMIVALMDDAFGLHSTVLQRTQNHFHVSEEPSTTNISESEQETSCKQQASSQNANRELNLNLQQQIRATCSNLSGILSETIGKVKSATTKGLELTKGGGLSSQKELLAERKTSLDSWSRLLRVTAAHWFIRTHLARSGSLLKLLQQNVDHVRGDQHGQHEGDKIGSSDGFRVPLSDDHQTETDLASLETSPAIIKRLRAHSLSDPILKRRLSNIDSSNSSSDSNECNDLDDAEKVDKNETRQSTKHEKHLSMFQRLNTTAKAPSLGSSSSTIETISPLNESLLLSHNNTRNTPYGRTTVIHNKTKKSTNDQLTRPKSAVSILQMYAQSMVSTASSSGLEQPFESVVNKNVSEMTGRDLVCQKRYIHQRKPSTYTIYSFVEPRRLPDAYSLFHPRTRLTSGEKLAHACAKNMIEVCHFAIRSS
ncbi:unnamed protein product [Anisakis simplex]|uniref:ANK_REP_REGION domain-containing protein n=1 Tax=Anisakis simplex TaxID=6269 RepID=A0A0M3J467_ANISI|nr:unnamed protein product [Anisakis simplex]